jgi:hypothetical protein
MSWDKVRHYSARGCGESESIPQLPGELPGGLPTIPGGVPTSIPGLLSACMTDPSCKGAYFLAGQTLKGTSFEWCLGCQACSSCVKSAVDNPAAGPWDYMKCLETKAMYQACGVTPPGAQTVLGKLTDILSQLFLGTDPTPALSGIGRKGR